MEKGNGKTDSRRTRIILASASPRRRELLARIGLDFEVRTAGVDETTAVSEPAAMVEELSGRKAQAVLERLEAQGDTEEAVLIIGADTVVAVEGRILGKPSCEREAARMLGSLSGRSHEVYTGVTLLYRKAAPAGAGSPEVCSPDGEPDGRVCRRVFHEMTRVSFYPMTEAEILSYVATGDCMDKAGAYGIQGIFARYVEKIEGDYNNVVGLPAGRLYQEAKEWLRE